MANKTEAIVIEMAEPIAEALGLEVVDVEYLKEGSNWYLRVYIDKEGGVLIDDCEALSRQLEQKLDETDPIEKAYILEVSSPGLERPLKREKDFVRFAGREITVKLYKPLNGQKQVIGILKGYSDGTVLLVAGGSELSIAKENIAAAKLNFDFGAL